MIGCPAGALIYAKKNSTHGKNISPHIKKYVLPTNQTQKGLEDTKTINILQNNIIFLPGFPEIMGHQWQKKFEFSKSYFSKSLPPDPDIRVNLILNTSNIEALYPIFWLLFLLLRHLLQKFSHCCEIDPPHSSE